MRIRPSGEPSVDRPSGALPWLILIAVGVATLAFVAVMQVSGRPSTDAPSAPESAPPSPSPSASPSPSPSSAVASPSTGLAVQIDLQPTGGG